MAAGASGVVISAPYRRHTQRSIEAARLLLLSRLSEVRNCESLSHPDFLLIQLRIMSCHPRAAPSESTGLVAACSPSWEANVVSMLPTNARPTGTSTAQAAEEEAMPSRMPEASVGSSPLRAAEVQWSPFQYLVHSTITCWKCQSARSSLLAGSLARWSLDRHAHGAGFERGTCNLWHTAVGLPPMATREPENQHTAVCRNFDATQAPSPLPKLCLISKDSSWDASRRSLRILASRILFCMPLSMGSGSGSASSPSVQHYLREFSAQGAVTSAAQATETQRFPEVKQVPRVLSQTHGALNSPRKRLHKTSGKREGFTMPKFQSQSSFSKVLVRGEASGLADVTSACGTQTSQNLSGKWPLAGLRQRTLAMYTGSWSPGTRCSLP